MPGGKYILNIVVLLFCSVNIFAQDFIGLRTDNYSGSNGMLLNPAMPIGGKLPWDINAVAFGINEDNNYLKISDPLVKYVTTSDSIINVDFYNPNKLYGHGNVLLQLPSGFVKFDDYAVGAFFTARTAGYVLSKKDTQAVSRVIDVPIDSNLYLPEFNAAALIWGEVGINGEMTLESNSLFAIHIGVNLKYLAGFEAVGFRNNSEFNYIKDTVNTYTPYFDADFDYTRNLGSNLLYDPDNYALNGSGFGMDIGGYFVVHKKSKFKYSRKLDYTWKFGAALVDLGAIKFKSNSGSYHLLQEEPLIVANIVLDSIGDIDEFNRTGSRTIYDNSDASKDASAFTMYLPAALVLTVDKPLPHNFYVQAMIVRRLPNFETNLIARSNIFALTPRYEGRKLGVYLPMSLYEDKEFRMGAAARFMFLTVGSDNLRTWFNEEDYASIDFYVGIKLNPFWLVPDTKKRFLECLKW